MFDRSFVETIQELDGFKYSERQACNKDGSDGTRFRYVCSDSLQNRDCTSNVQKVKEDENAEPGKKREKKRGTPQLATYDCGGAVHVKFSTKRDAINIIYKHNPIHRDVQSRPANGDR